MRCLDCDAEVPRRESGRGSQKIRCARCARRALRPGAIRRCMDCRTGVALPGKSRCEPCWQAKNKPAVMHVKRCVCGRTFETRSPLYRYCSRACGDGAHNRQKKAPTTERGYGGDHQRRRAELLRESIGKNCELCGEIMLASDKLDADHVIPVLQGGKDGPLRIVHRWCHQRRKALECRAA